MSELAPYGVNLGLSELSAQIAMELAAGLSSPEAIKQRYHISDEKWEQLRTNEMFRAMVSDAVKELQGDLNAKRRIQLKAAMAVEDNILHLVSMFHDEGLPASARLDAHGHLVNLAEVGTKATRLQEGGGGKDGFTLIINFPDGNQLNVTPGKEPIDGEIEAAN